MMSSIELKYERSKKGYAELLKQHPFNKKLFNLIIIGAFIISIMFSINLILSSRDNALFYNQPVLLNVSSIIIGLLVYIGILVPICFIAYKLGNEWNGRKLFQKYQNVNDNFYFVKFNDAKGEFLIQKGRSTVSVSQKIFVLDTHKYILIYGGKGKNDEAFFITKDGNLEHREKIKQIQHNLKDNTEVVYKHFNNFRYKVIIVCCSVIGFLFIFGFLALYGMLHLMG
jgi:hypothetical protein